MQIDFETMSLWTEADAVAYFESGGEFTPPPPGAGPPPPVPLGRAPRIALLHGTAGNTTILKMQTSALQRELAAAGAELHVIEGSRECEKDNPQLQPMVDYFGDSHKYKEYARAVWDERRWRTYEAKSMESAITYLEAALAKLPGGGVDVLVGFSQGANMITCLAARAERAGRPYRATVLLSLQLPGWAAQEAELFASPLRTPSLIIWAPSDTTVYHPDTKACGPVECSKLFEAGYATQREHGGPGHRPLPKDKPEATALVGEIKAFVEAWCPR